MLQVLKKNGELSATIFFDTPINKLKMAWEPKRNNYDIVEKKKQYADCVDAEYDNTGRLFVVVSTRPPKETECTSMLIFRTGSIVYYPKSKSYPEKTDLYRLMVFGTDGKILAVKQLDIFCDQIVIGKNRIFMVDKTFAQLIYEYRYKLVD